MKKLLILTLLFFSQVTSVQSSTSALPASMKEYGRLYGIDPVLLYAISRVESNHNPKAVNHDDGNSHDKRHGVVKKSYGLFQIQVDTAKQYGFSSYHKLLLDPKVNTLFACLHLNHLYKRYRNTEKVLSAYNAGHYTSKNKSYVDKVTKYYILYKIDGRYSE